MRHGFLPCDVVTSRRIDGEAEDPRQWVVIAETWRPAALSLLLRRPPDRTMNGP
ncbi:Hypothetical protein A7982_07012 [Minicystis rosea]|nr:Hypothetical protein A7982_07012 [Minicystis rosea]